MSAASSPNHAAPGASKHRGTARLLSVAPTIDLNHEPLRGREEVRNVAVLYRAK